MGTAALVFLLVCAVGLAAVLVYGMLWSRKNRG